VVVRVEKLSLIDFLGEDRWRASSSAGKLGPFIAQGRWNDLLSLRGEDGSRTVRLEYSTPVRPSSPVSEAIMPLAELHDDDGSSESSWSPAFSASESDSPASESESAYEPSSVASVDDYTDASAHDQSNYLEASASQSSLSTQGRRNDLLSLRGENRSRTIVWRPISLCHCIRIAGGVTINVARLSKMDED